MKSRIIAYYRVSTQKQGQSGLGLEAQQTTVAAHIQATGCKLIASYTEVESGKRADRPELAKAMAHCQRVGAKLVIARLDRLARNMAFVANLMDSGVDFICCDMSNANRLTLHIMAAVAEDYCARLSANTKAALAEAKAKGVKLGGVRQGQHTLTQQDRAKGGAKGGSKGGAKSATGKRTAAIDAYADLVEGFEHLKTVEGMSYQAIADYHNEHGHTTRTGAKWTGVQVRRALNRVLSFE